MLNTKNTILHLDLDTFFVSVERLLDSRLNDLPILIGGTSARGVVSSCSYEARAYGVYPMMPMKVARLMCPEGVIIRGNSGKYSHYSNIITDIIKEEVPIFEKCSIDEFYVDLTGMDRFFGCFKLAAEIRNKIAGETGLPISFGMAVNKTVSKVATGEAKPNGQKQIEAGLEKSFLAPLSIRKIPMVGVGTYKMLSDMGVKKVKTVQHMPMELMERVMGKTGSDLWKKANGIDNAPIIPYNERKSISMERTFGRDTIDVAKMKSVLIAMTESMAYQLRMGHKLTSCITLKLRYSDFKTYTQQARIPYTSCDHILIEKTLILYKKLYNRRLLVRLVGLRFSRLVEGGHQINLLDDSEAMIKLYQAMDKMRKKYGSRVVKRAVGMDVRTMGVGNPFNGQPPVPPANRHA